jgi:predicted PhzF superfamily epimerase YddE/YHI9
LLFSPIVVLTCLTNLPLAAADTPTHLNFPESASVNTDAASLEADQPLEADQNAVETLAPIAAPAEQSQITTTEGSEPAPAAIAAMETLPPTASLPAANPPTATPFSSDSMAQVTSVSQLSDVQPTDWAFQALQSLVERYGVIAGYPDGTYRGNRALTRYEFAAGLNAALDRVNELIAAGLADAVTQEDLATLRRLQEEFAAELTVLGGRVDALEARTAELEANQFSTTTVLNGETIIALTSPIAGESATGEQVDRNPTLGYRIRLNLNTTFSGEDLLTTRLQANNITPLGGTLSGLLGTNEGRVEYDGDSNSEVQLGLLRYRFPISARTNIYLAGTGNGFVDLDASSQLTPYLDGTAVSLFALRNPIYNYSAGTGFGLRHFFNDNIELNLGYLSPNANNPENRNGLFNGKYGALAQVIVYPTESIRLGFTYINSYTPRPIDISSQPEDPIIVEFGPATGSNLANQTFGRPTVVNAYGVSGTIDITPGIAFGGWVGYAHHRYIGRGDATMWTWAGSLSFPDLFGEGNLGGILVGMEPRVTAIDDAVNGGEPDDDVSLHLEGFYRYRITDNIDITPGVIWTTAPDHESANEDVVIGVLRTRFFF